MSQKHFFQEILLLTQFTTIFWAEFETTIRFAVPANFVFTKNYSQMIPKKSRVRTVWAEKLESGKKTLLVVETPVSNKAFKKNLEIWFW